MLGWLPFSFGDVMYALAIIYIFRWTIKNFKKLKTDTKNWLLDVFSAISIVYFAFHLFWGLSYYRLPLYKSLSLKSHYTTEQLVDVTKKLIIVSNKIHAEINKNDTLPIDIPYSKSTILKMVPLGYTNLEKQYPHLEYHPKSIKKSLFSLPLTYMGFSGYLNP